MRLCNKLFTRLPPHPGVFPSSQFSVLILMMSQRHLSKSHCPGRPQPGHLPVDRTVRVVGARQVASREQEFLDDLATGEDKGFLQDLNGITTRKASYFQRKSFSNRQLFRIVAGFMDFYRQCQWTRFRTGWIRTGRTTTPCTPRTNADGSPLRKIL